MVKKLLVVGLIAFSFSACTRDVRVAEVPADVVTAFNQRYPEATETEWQEDDGLYEVEFYDELEDNVKTATYRPDGTLINTGESI